MYREYRDARDRLSRAGGPAVESDDRKEWWVEGRRHREDGPAIVTIQGTELWYWRGMAVPRELVEAPRNKNPMDVLKIANVELRRAWMESYGMSEFIDDIDYETIHRDEEKDLLLVKIPITVKSERPEDMEPMVMVRVKNSTPEPDGHFKYYWLRVPPTMTDANEAVAWTFRMDKKSYRPDVET
jgi:hypothetical protein